MMNNLQLLYFILQMFSSQLKHTPDGVCQNGYKVGNEVMCMDKSIDLEAGHNKNSCTACCLFGHNHSKFSET